MTTCNPGRISAEECFQETAFMTERSDGMATNDQMNLHRKVSSYTPVSGSIGAASRTGRTGSGWSI